MDPHSLEERRLETLQRPHRKGATERAWFLERQIQKLRAHRLVVGRGASRPRLVFKSVQTAFVEASDPLAATGFASVSGPEAGFFGAESWVFKQRPDDLSALDQAGGLGARRSQVIYLLSLAVGDRTETQLIRHRFRS